MMIGNSLSNYFFGFMYEEGDDDDDYDEYDNNYNNQTHDNRSRIVTTELIVNHNANDDEAQLLMYPSATEPCNSSISRSNATMEHKFKKKNNAKHQTNALIDFLDDTSNNHYPVHETFRHHHHEQYNHINSNSDNNNNNSKDDKMWILAAPTTTSQSSSSFYIQKQPNYSQQEQQRQQHPPSNSCASSSLLTKTNNRLNMALCVSLFLQSIACSIPVTVINQIGNNNNNNGIQWITFQSSSIGSDQSDKQRGKQQYRRLQQEQYNISNNSSSSYFASRVISSSVLGISFGKIINGPMIDIIGARRTSIRHSLLLCTSLLLLAYSCYNNNKNDSNTIYHSCFLIEFANSVQWPCNIVILAKHYSNLHQQQETIDDVCNESIAMNSNSKNDRTSSGNRQYEGGIFVTSVASRLGSLFGIPFGSYLLRQYNNNSDNSNSSSCTYIALLGAYIALLASSITYFFVQDSPNQINEPQNPVDAKVLQRLYNIVRIIWDDTTAVNSSTNYCNDNNYKSSSLSTVSEVDEVDEVYDSGDDVVVIFDYSNQQPSDAFQPASSQQQQQLRSRIGNNNAHTIKSSDVINRNGNSNLHPVGYDDAKWRYYQRRLYQCCILFVTIIQVIITIIQTNIIPSLRNILCNRIFWIMALAHTGSAMVRTSERIIGTYLYDTNNNNSKSSSSSISPSNASALSVFLSIGIILGLLIAGTVFSRTTDDRERKYIISRLYILTIISIYILALLAIPAIRNVVESNVLVLLQVITITITGFGIAVQSYHIPSIVGAKSFSGNQGLYSAYIDGVAYGISSYVWRIVGNAIHHTGGTATTSSTTNQIATNANDVGAGWAYGWAAVALLVILSGVLMVEFMEHYLCPNSSKHRINVSRW